MGDKVGHSLDHSIDVSMTVHANPKVVGSFDFRLDCGDVLFAGGESASLLLASCLLSDTIS